MKIFEFVILYSTLLLAFAALGAEPAYVRNPWDTNQIPVGGTASNSTLTGTTTISGPAVFLDPSTNALLWLDYNHRLQPATMGSGVSFSGGILSATGSGGTVTSVGLSLPGGLSVSGSPVTGSGTLAVSAANTAGFWKNNGSGVTSWSTDGSSLTSLTAGNLTGSHTLPSGVLPTDVPFTDQDNAWTGSNNFGGQTFVQHALISSLSTSQLQPLSNGTNFGVDFNVPVSSFTPTNNVFFIFSTNFSTSGSQDKLFKLQGSASNFTVKFGTDLTNLYGVWSTNGYILANSNGPHLIAIHIDAAHGTEAAAIVPPNN